MKTRIISGIIMVPLLLIIYFGGYPLLIAAAAIAYVGVTEFCNGFEHMDVHPSKWIAYIMITVLYAGHLILGVNQTFLLAWIVLSIMVSMIYAWRITEKKPYDGVATMTALVYIVLFSYHIVIIDNTAYPEMTWLVVIAAFGSDIMAYFTGYFLGKHKMAPNLSPKKTIEGGVGGVLGSAIFCALFGYFCFPSLMLHCMVIGVLGGLVAEAGDLTASMFKRGMGIKDYGNLIPGHGGIMDRFDSVIFVAPVVCYYILFVLENKWLCIV